MALEKRNYKQLVETTQELATKARLCRCCVAARFAVPTAHKRDETRRHGREENREGVIDCCQWGRERQLEEEQ